MAASERVIRGPDRRLLVGLLLAVFTTVVSSTVLVNALPSISRDLGGGGTTYTWIISASLLANLGSTPLWSRLADAFGKKSVMQVALLLFLLATITSATAPSMSVLLLARVGQGTALGGVLALAQAVLASVIAPRARGVYAGYIGGALMLSATIGPLFGGFIVSSPLGWRWSFWGCIPTAVLAMLIIHRHLSLPPRATAPNLLGWFGAALMAVGILLVVVTVFPGKFSSWVWTHSGHWLAVPVAVVVIVSGIAIGIYAKDPLIPFQLLRVPTISLAVIASLVVGFTVFGIPVFTSQYFQVSRGFTAMSSGLLALPQALGNFFGTLVSGRITSRYGRLKICLLPGSVLITVGLIPMACLHGSSSLAIISIATFLIGSGCGFLAQNLVLAVQNSVELTMVGRAGGLVSLFRLLTGATLTPIVGNVVSSYQIAVPISGRIVDNTARASMTGHLLPPQYAWTYGESTWIVFALTIPLGIVCIMAVLFMPNVSLRATLDLREG